LNRIASGILDGLKSQPLALALVIVNVLYLIAGTVLLREANTARERRTDLVTTMMQKCMDAPR
jgi:hypothetical protein